VVTLEDLPPRLAGLVKVNPASGCWVGQTYIDKDGYARLGGKGLHRVVWEETVGPIPPRLVLDHREDWGCLTKACCWPEHLRPATNRVNVLRGTSFSAVNARKDECDSGHPYDLFNTYYRPNGHRDCRTCIRARVAKYRKKQRGLALAA
jgi:hypothetical protein